jgi:hypothetical protein
MNDLGSNLRLEPLSRPFDSDDEAVPTLSTAELAECTCPEFCERDHDND